MKCRCCGSFNVIRYGKLKSGKQVYLCKDCHRYWVDNPTFSKYPETIRAKAISLVRQGKPVREVSRELLVPKTTIYKWISKSIREEK